MRGELGDKRACFYNVWGGENMLDCDVTSTPIFRCHDWKLQVCQPQKYWEAPIWPACLMVILEGGMKHEFKWSEIPFNGC